MPDETLRQLADEVHNAVAGLEQLIARKYPNKEEVARDYVTKETARNRVVWAVIILLISSLLNVLSTVTVVSTCFLIELGDKPPGVCNAMPGYKEQQKNSGELLKLFNKLVATTSRNDRRLDRLEEQNGKP